MNAETLAEALHRADVSVPCPWRRQPVKDCPLLRSHEELAREVLNQLGTGFDPRLGYIVEKHLSGMVKP